MQVLPFFQERVWIFQRKVISLQRETPPSAKALALFCYPPYCKVGFFVPFWGYFGTFCVLKPFLLRLKSEITI